MEGLSLLFTQLGPWKGLLNMKFDMSNEVTGRNEGNNPSGREGGREVAVRGSNTVLDKGC